MSSACDGHTGRLVEYFGPMLQECERRKADLDKKMKALEQREKAVEHRELTATNQPECESATEITKLRAEITEMKNMRKESNEKLEKALHESEKQNDQECERRKADLDKKMKELEQREKAVEHRELTATNQPECESATEITKLRAEITEMKNMRKENHKRDLLNQELKKALHESEEQNNQAFQNLSKAIEKTEELQQKLREKEKEKPKQDNVGKVGVMKPDDSKQMIIYTLTKTKEALEKKNASLEVEKGALKEQNGEYEQSLQKLMQTQQELKKIQDLRHLQMKAVTKLKQDLDTQQAQIKQLGEEGNIQKAELQEKSAKLAELTEKYWTRRWLDNDLLQFAPQFETSGEKLREKLISEFKESCQYHYEKMKQMPQMQQMPQAYLQGRKSYYTDISDCIKKGLNLKTNQPVPDYLNLPEVLESFLTYVSKLSRATKQETIHMFTAKVKNPERYINQELGVTWPSRIVVDDSTELGKPSKKRKVLGY